MDTPRAIAALFEAVSGASALAPVRPRAARRLAATATVLARWPWLYCDDPDVFFGKVGEKPG